MHDFLLAQSIGHYVQYSVERKFGVEAVSPVFQPLHHQIQVIKLLSLAARLPVREEILQGLYPPRPHQPLRVQLRLGVPVHSLLSVAHFSLIKICNSNSSLFSFKKKDD